MKYAEIFQLRIRHSYFASGYCPDLRITPRGDTLARVRGHRMLLQTQSDRIVLLGETNPDGQLRLPPDAGLTFQFALAPTRQRFFRNTRLPAAVEGQLRFTNTGARATGAQTFALAQNLETEPQDPAWAVVEIAVDSAFALPPAAPNIYTVDFQSIQTPWNVYLTTAQNDDYLRIDGTSGGIYFYKAHLGDLRNPENDYLRLTDLDRDQRWATTNRSGRGADFLITALGLQSQGPASPATIYAATEVAPVDGISMQFRLTLPFAPDANNRLIVHASASHPDPDHPEFTAYSLEIGENGVNQWRFVRRDTAQGSVEIARGTSTQGGPLDDQLALTWKDDEWSLESGLLTQNPVEEFRVADNALPTGGYLIFQAIYDDINHSDQYTVSSLEIRIPLGDAADIERKKAVADTLAELFPEKRQFLFASAGPVELKETPRKGISLKNGSSTLIEHMGNPSPDDNGTQFIHI
ncbi:MAG: hypothetical protein AAGN35_21495 [Bacteroidota bacterium]